MNIEELERTISLTRARIRKCSSPKLKNDLGKYLRKLIKERNDYYMFQNKRNML
jgi:TATA-binding protein-associated factor Taf7